MRLQQQARKCLVWQLQCTGSTAVPGAATSALTSIVKRRVMVSTAFAVHESSRLQQNICLAALGAAGASKHLLLANMLAPSEAASWLGYGLMCQELSPRSLLHLADMHMLPAQALARSVPVEGGGQRVPLGHRMPFNTSRLEGDQCVHGLRICGPLKNGLSNGMPPACYMQGSDALDAKSQSVKRMSAADSPASHTLLPALRASPAHAPTWMAQT